MIRVRVILADDHTLLLDGLRKLLEVDFDLVGLASNGQELVQAAERLKPDVILLDISMPLMNGLDAARLLKQRDNKAFLIFLTMHKDPAYVKEAFRAGASGYVLKHSAGTELVNAVREVMRGHFYLSPLVSKETLIELLGVSEPGSARRDKQLTERQCEVLRLVAEGQPSKIIADTLGIAQKTVEFHRNSIMKRLGLHSTAELTRYAVRSGILPPEEE